MSASLTYCAVASRTMSALFAAIVLAAVLLTGCAPDHAVKSSPPTSSAPDQTVVPFQDLMGMPTLAADSAGTIYALDTGNKRVLAIPAGADRQKVLPFDGVDMSDRIVIDSGGAVYVRDGSSVYQLPLGADRPTVIDFSSAGADQSTPLADFAVDPHGNVFAVTGDPVVAGKQTNRVLEMPKGASTPIALPFSAIGFPVRLDVDAAGNLYVSDALTDRVLKLAAGSDAEEVLPLTGATGMEVDDAGNVYAWDRPRNQVIALTAGSTTQRVLPFNGLDTISDQIAVDAQRAVYVPDSGHGRVLKWKDGATDAQVLPIVFEADHPGLFAPQRVAVDPSGNVYVATGFNDTVLKLNRPD
jgi:serine/threonine protein kinase, bacterial